MSSTAVSDYTSQLTPKARISGAVGATGIQGPTGPSGVPGTKGADAVQFAYLGCWFQGCFPNGNCNALGSYGLDSTATQGGYNSTVPGTASANIDAQCSNLCITKAGANFFGTVNNGTVLGDCYCGNAVTGTNTGLLITSCPNCNGQTVGKCGTSGNTIAIYARAF